MAEHSGPPPAQQPAQQPAQKPAQRLVRRRWADPRLLVGVVLVAVSVVVGAMIIEASDDTTSVWALRVDVRAGEAPQVSDLERVDVHVGDSVARRYLAGGEQAIAQRLEKSTWAHDVPAGELLAASALTGRDDAGSGELPLKVAVGSLPADLRPGQWVDVWVRPARSGGEPGEARRVLEQVRVVAVRAPSGAFGEGASRTVLVALEEPAVDDLGAVLARVGRGDLTLVRVSAVEAS